MKNTSGHIRAKRAKRPELTKERIEELLKQSVKGANELKKTFDREHLQAHSALTLKLD